MSVKLDPERDAKALVPDEAAAPIVRRIFAMRLDGHKWAAIVRALNEAGVPSPRDGFWTHNTVSTIVRNEVYTGVVILGKRRLEGAHEPLVSHADWKRAQATRAVVRSGRYAAGLAGGLVECSGCGRPLKVAGQDRRLVYGCRRSSTAGACPRPVYVSKDATDDFLEATIVDLLERGGGIDVVASARELEAARAAAEAATAERKAFVRLTSGLDVDDFRAGYAQRQERERELWHVYDELLADASEVRELPAGRTAWEQLDLAHQRAVARSLIDTVVVAPPLSRSPRAPIDRDF